jgi:hypothetical protein
LEWVDALIAYRAEVCPVVPEVEHVEKLLSRLKTAEFDRRSSITGSSVFHSS